MDSKLVFIILMTVIAHDATSCDIDRCVCKNEPRSLVNECADSSLNNCDPNAACFDLQFSFACVCNTGFTGNGTFCEEKCDNSTCFAANRECYLNQSCLCTPGFHELSNGTCVEACDTYGDSFIDYQQTVLSCGPRLALESFNDLSACQSACLNETGCISISFNPLATVDNCNVYECDPLTQGAGFAQVSSDSIASVRNCA